MGGAFAFAAKYWYYLRQLKSFKIFVAHQGFNPRRRITLWLNELSGSRGG